MPQPNPSPQGVQEVPILPTAQITDSKTGKTHTVLLDSQQLRSFLISLRQNVVTQQQSQAPLAAPINLTVTQEDRGNLIQFTRTPGADYTEVLWSATPSIQQAQVLNITTSNSLFDYLGQVAVARYYWVRARRNGSPFRSPETGPVKGTTQAVGTAVNFPNPPPIGQQIVKNTQNGRNEFL